MSNPEPPNPAIPPENSDATGNVQISRRAFLTGAALGTAAAALPLQTSDAAPAKKGLAPLGPGPAPLAFTLNGKKVMTQAEPRESLADVLLWRLDQTETKIGCNRGSCGACTVWINDTPRASCLTAALDAEGQDVTTAAGLDAAFPGFSRLLQAMVHRDAMQCGYCIPGFAMSAAALLNRNSAPSEGDVKAALAGNLCRCGSQPHIVQAILDVSRQKDRP